MLGSGGRACWPDAILFWGVVYASYARSAGLALAALFGTGGTTPIARAGHGGLPWQESLVDVLLTTARSPSLAGCVAALVGLGGRRHATAPQA